MLSGNANGAPRLPWSGVNGEGRSVHKRSSPRPCFFESVGINVKNLINSDISNFRKRA